MLKKILGILAVVLVLAYLVFASLRFADAPGKRVCKDVVIQVMDSSGHAYVSPSEIKRMLELNGLVLKGTPLDQLPLARVERVVSALRMVRKVECYASNSGEVQVQVWQHEPILRVVLDNGSFYVDRSGKRLDISLNSAADVPVATGAVLDSVRVDRLHRLAVLLEKDSFWNAQIEQVCVEPNGEWVLIPRVGDFDIEFGLPNNMEDKLDRLRLFWLKALPKAGWNTYSSISVKYRNQIVCTKKQI